MIENHFIRHIRSRELSRHGFRYICNNAPRENEIPMYDSIRLQDTVECSIRASLAARIAALAFAVLLLPALAADPPGAGAPKANPRLANLQIEIWPEFDRPAALVILKGEIAAGVTLPAAVSLRIEASSGGPSAVAYSSGANANLLNLKYERVDAKDFITLKFALPERFFHVEFYEPISTTAPERIYSYVWPGDLASERLGVIVQEPAAVSGFSVQPDLPGAALGQNGLRYRSADLGAIEAGKSLPIRIRYSKAESRPSAELIKARSPESAAVPVPAKNSAAAPSAVAPPASTPASSAPPDWVLILGGVLVVVIAAVPALLSMRRRKAGTQPGSAGFCAKCGAARAVEDRFCPKCGVRHAK